MKTSRTAHLCLVLVSACCAHATAADQQPPAAPASQQPPEAPPRSTVQAPPPLPKVTDIRQPGETGLWIGLLGWFPTQGPVMDKGYGATFTTLSRTTLQGKPKVADGAELGFAVGLHNALRFTYFDSRASGNLTTATTDIRLWNQTYTPGTYLSTNYRLQNGKISFDYLTWPYPVETRRFRLKTLWQVQYTSIRTGFDAPLLPTVDANGNPIVDASGNAVNYAGQGTHWFISPSVGVGLAYWTTKNFRLEANASGFGIPRHTDIWDADASANFRFGHLELRGGAKAFHFKTSTQAEYFMRGTLASAFVGVRWYSK